MTTSTSRTVSTISVILGLLVTVAVIIFATFFHSFLHIELHPLDDNHLVVGSATALLTALLVTTLYLRNSKLSYTIEKKDFQLASLYEDNAFFRLLSEKSSDMVHLNDAAGTILYVNPVTTDLLGYEKDEIVNKPAGLFIHPDDREDTRNDMGMVAQGADIPPRIIRLLKKSGDFLDVEVKGFFLNAEGEERYIGAILRDLSGLKENKELLELKEEWEKTFNSIDDFISVHDKDFKVVKANRALCELLGKSMEEIVGKPCYQLFHNMNEPVKNCPHAKTAKSERATTEIIADPNIGVPLQITCSPILDNGGNFQGSVHIARVLDEAESNAEELIPICAACKNIRTSDNTWTSPEEYFVKKYDSKFTHTVCRDCQGKLYPEYIKL